jgi:hypothetical protein
MNSVLYINEYDDIIDFLHLASRLARRFSRLAFHDLSDMDFLEVYNLLMNNQQALNIVLHCMDRIRTNETEYDAGTFGNTLFHFILGLPRGEDYLDILETLTMLREDFGV